MSTSAYLVRMRPAAASLRAVALLVLLLVAFFVSAGLFSPLLLLDNVRQAAPLGVVVLGQAIVLMMGRLDLSVGATASMANIVLCAVFAGDMANTGPAVALTLGAGALVGLANGLMTTKLRIPSFLATLATSMIVAGLVVFFTGGSPRGAVPAGFRVVTEAWLFGFVPYSALIWLALLVLLMLLVHFTMLGRKMILSGANLVAARHSGIPSDGLIVLAFVLSSLLAATGGILVSAITGMASIGVGNGFTLDSIAAAVIGGALFSGGVFLPLGAMAGALILFVVQSLLYLLALPPAAKFIVQGLIIMLALALASFRKEKSS
ncbi:ABC transporter permease [Prosthecomicrobium pneumaticum]|uniref:Ribose/xylose/arabinose/galactoside ABC-type transport system permease subunit n=1 Tax=Prosthecomicrobium pneumaticum TaxID=81895 RepID=A0A7W9CTM8_9HYPH|nr:ABC transporter permease [Prosthecomicrobium pneumaticum]MBB5751657.1 ribose/xylose/arabinose/galactoside ABC-type transport system permease subunit [Prosthecomicrobium pneumaticum]